MKKLFASLLAATMVAGMAVSAFAYCGTDAADIAGGNRVAIADAADQTTDYSLTKTIYTKKGADVAGKTDGGKIFMPILISDEVFDEANGNSHIDGYAYATKASEVEDLKVKVKAKVGAKYFEKEAKIVRKENMIAGHLATKVYCVEIKVADFADTEIKEIEFDVTLYNKNRKEANVEKIHLDYGFDAKDVSAAVVAPAANAEFSKAPKFKEKDGDLTLYIKKDAKAYKLDETDLGVNDKDIELITLEMVEADNDATFEVAASSQDDLFLGYSTDANKALVVANPEANINFLDFDANPTFDFTGTLKLSVEDPEKTNFCYEVKDGKVTPVGKYNAEDECFEIKTRTLGSYAISDKELVNVPSKEEEKPAEQKPVEEKPADKVVGTGAIA